MLASLARVAPLFNPAHQSKRMVKKQQMQWSESGAHNLLQVRTKMLNDQLRETFVAPVLTYAVIVTLIGLTLWFYGWPRGTCWRSSQPTRSMNFVALVYFLRAHVRRHRAARIKD